MIKEFNFDFGIEEFAVVLSLTKKTDEANGMIFSTFGKLSSDEERGRLLAAYNSLFARGLLGYKEGEFSLHTGIRKMLDIFFKSRKLVKTGKSVDTGENVISYYAHQNVWLEHSVIQGVAHRFRYPIAKQDAQKNIEKFLLPHSPSNIKKVSVDISSDLILNTSPGNLSNYDTVLNYLKKNGNNISPEMRYLAEDISNGEWRGSTIWMDRSSENQLLSRGYLWIQGKERFWFINSGNSDEPFILRATLCEKNDFSKNIRELIDTSYA